MREAQDRDPERRRQGRHSEGGESRRKVGWRLPRLQGPGKCRGAWVILLTGFAFGSVSRGDCASPFHGSRHVQLLGECEISIHLLGEKRFTSSSLASRQMPCLDIAHPTLLQRSARPLTLALFSPRPVFLVMSLLQNSIVQYGSQQLHVTM